MPVQEINKTNLPHFTDYDTNQNKFCHTVWQNTNTKREINLRRLPALQLFTNKWIKNHVRAIFPVDRELLACTSGRVKKERYFCEFWLCCSHRTTQHPHGSLPCTVSKRWLCIFFFTKTARAGRLCFFSQYFCNFDKHYCTLCTIIVMETPQASYTVPEEICVTDNFFKLD